MKKLAMVALAVFAALVVAGLFLKSGEQVAASDFGDDWPFTVSEGRLNCEREMALTFEANGTVYGLNGPALSWLGAEPPHAIWLQDPRYPGTDLRKNIGPIISAAQALC